MKMPWSSPGALARRFMLGVVPASLAGMVLLGGSAFYYTRLHITKSVNKEMDAFSKGAASGVSVFFRQRENDIEALSETSLLADYYNNADYGLSEEAGQYRRELERYFRSFSQRAKVYNRVFFADADGRPVCGIENSKPMTAGGYSGAAGILRRIAAGKKSGVFMSPVSMDPLYGPKITYAKPVFDELKNLRGAIILEASLRPLQEILARLRVGNNGRTYLTDSANIPVLAWKDVYETGPVSPTDFTALESIPGTELRVMLSAPMSDFQAPLTSISRVTVFLVVSCGLLVWVLIYFTIRGIVRPIEKLVLATQSLAAGRGFEKVEISSRDEIGVLADSFNIMGDQLLERTRDLESRIKELLVLQGMSAAVIENLDEEHICRVCLEAAVSGLGFDRGILYLVDRKKNLIMGRYVHSTEEVGFDEDKMRARAVPLDSDDILADVVRRKKAVNVKNPGDAPGINRRFIEEVATKAFCLVPVMTEQKVLGIIGADNYYTGREITDDQMHDLALFGNFTALALENADLVSSVKMSEARYRTVLDNSPDAIIGLDASLRVNVWNRGAQALFGYPAEDISGQLVSRLFDPLAFEGVLRQVRKDGYFADCCVPAVSAMGKKLELDVTWAGSDKYSGNRKEWTVVMRDTSEQRKTQAQLLQAEKLSAVGQLISGVAHELNNPLGAIIGYAEILYKNRAGGTSLVPSEDLAAIYQSSVRCGKIIKNLLLFVRETRNRKQTISLEQVANSSIGLMDYKLKKTENIRVTIHKSSHLPPVMADYHQIEQILVNLLQNACDALSKSDADKKIEIDIRHHITSVFITIADNGPGIPQDILPRIFDPFFTTKEEGQGTGLGLPICRRIAEEHGGSISCSSSPGRGTEFTLELPVVKPSSGPASEKDETILKPAPGLRILVVDDEPDMLAMLRRMLEDAGQVVDAASSGPAAIVKLNNGGYDLVICDVEMGPVKGFSVREAMLGMSSTAGFIFTTGNVLSASLMRKLKDSNVPFLTKPFSMDELYGAITDALA
jgi:two-component system NtrC family sensor kinase